MRKGYVVEFWSYLLERYARREFDFLEEAVAFAKETRGIIIA